MSETPMEAAQPAAPDKSELKAALKYAKKQSKLARKTGPLAPWRLSLSVAAAAVLTGSRLLDALEPPGSDLDFALLRSFGVGFVAWFVLGLINRVFVAVQIRDITERMR